MYTKELVQNLNVCFNCDHHIPLTAHDRIQAISDEGAFQEFDAGMIAANPLEFQVMKKTTKDRQKTGLNDAVVTGISK